MHQHSLYTFAMKFGFFKSRTTPSALPTFTIPKWIEEDDDGPACQFLSPIKSAPRRLSDLQLRHLREHYLTVYELASLQDEELRNIDQAVQIWHRCQKKGTFYHCSEYQRENSTRLSHLACLKQQIDRNATRSARTHDEVMVDAFFYVYINFFCVHTFRNETNMLLYSQYRKFREHDGLVEDLGAHVYGFQDVEVLHHLCAKVQAHCGKIYIVDDQNHMEDRLLVDINSRKRPRR